jgi:hypothetical protein
MGSDTSGIVIFDPETGRIVTVPRPQPRPQG